MQTSRCRIGGWTLALLLAGKTAVGADVAVVVNSANSASVDKSLVAKIYLGEVKSWPGGGQIVAYDLPEDSATRAHFAREVVGRTVANLKALWAMFTFSGKAVPPRQLASDAEVKKAVAANSNSIGYISAASVDGTVKVVAVP